MGAWRVVLLALYTRQPMQRRSVEGAYGGVPEWSNGVVSKTIVGFAYRGFESLPLRMRGVGAWPNSIV